MNQEPQNLAQNQYMTTNQVIRVIQEHLEKSEVEEAAKLYSHCQEDVGYLLMTRMPRERPLQAKMAKMFFAAKDYEKAALVLEANEEYKRAAELYERTDQFENAAEMWLKIGEPKRAAHNHEKNGAWQNAAEIYTQLGDYERAAYCFEKAINHYLAGKYYYQLNKFQKSMELLQKIKEDEEHYLEATSMIANILAMHGYLDMAIAKYKSVSKSVPLSGASLSVYYNLAQLDEKKGDLGEALQYYRDVASVDSSYKDVQKRIADLSEKISDDKAVDFSEEEEGGEDMLEMLESQPIAEDVLPMGALSEYAQAQQTKIVSVMDGFEFLKNTSLFDRLSLTEMKRLWNICEVQDFGPDEIIIEQDEPGQGLFIVKWGKVIVQRIEGDKVTNLVQLGEGAHVGEMSLVDMAPTSARVIAGQDGAQVFAMTPQRFEDLLESDQRIAIKVYRVFAETFCQRLRKTTAELSALKAKVGD